MPNETPAIEARAYGPDSSPEQHEAVQSRVSLHHDDIVLYRELPVLSVYSIDVCYDRVQELIERHGCRLMIIDAREAGRPDADLRRQIKARVGLLEGKLLHIGVVMNTNPMLKVAARFIQATLPVPLRAYDSLEEAEEAMRNAIE